MSDMSDLEQMLRHKIADIHSVIVNTASVPSEIIDDWMDWLLETDDPPRPITPVDAVTKNALGAFRAGLE